ncbi:hypothetical protein [Cupriavidus sp. HMR-1]|uniref:hypothetical protein n=1 Tax=Cupriavidus sp. HMR-1 TaxID=1249621 RepID=UPI00030583D0|nr:hypothetical protein [Cupriavidus sp. HMR-1]
MDQMTLVVGAGLSVVIALYVGVRVGMKVGRRDGAQEGAARMLGVFAAASERR